jgi:hypothetical protein
MRQLIRCALEPHGRLRVAGSIFASTSALAP